MQFGLHSKHSTSYTLISMTETIRKTTDGENYGCGIFIDLTKAFDTVNHGVLLKKLEHYRVRGTPLLWFESYLSNRKQSMEIHTFTEEERKVVQGAPPPRPRSFENR